MVFNHFYVTTICIDIVLYSKYFLEKYIKIIYLSFFLAVKRDWNASWTGLAGDLLDLPPSHRSVFIPSHCKEHKIWQVTAGLKNLNNLCPSPKRIAKKELENTKYLTCYLLYSEELLYSVFYKAVYKYKFTNQGYSRLFWLVLFLWNCDQLFIFVKNLVRIL